MVISLFRKSNFGVNRQVRHFHPESAGCPGNFVQVIYFCGILDPNHAICFLPN